MTATTRAHQVTPTRTHLPHNQGHTRDNARWTSFSANRSESNRIPHERGNRRLPTSRSTSLRPTRHQEYRTPQQDPHTKETSATTRHKRTHENQENTRETKRPYKTDGTHENKSDEEVRRGGSASGRTEVRRSLGESEYQIPLTFMAGKPTLFRGS